jgi:mRNA interferase RelE/StbE
MAEMDVKLTHKAQKQLDRLNEPLLGRVIKGLEGLVRDPPEGDIKPLQGQSGINRLRVGDYRVLFYEKDNSRYIFKITPRGGTYRGQK